MEKHDLVATLRGGLRQLIDYYIISLAQRLSHGLSGDAIRLSDIPTYGIDCACHQQEAAYAIGDGSKNAFPFHPRSSDSLVGIYPTEEAIPANTPIEETAILIQREPYHDRLTHHVIFGHETPVTAVGTVVAIIAHHPVVVVFKGIGGGLLSIDPHLTVLDVQLVALIVADATALER